MNHNTPRTEALLLRLDDSTYKTEAEELAKFARELESETIVLRDALNRRHREQSYPVPDYVCDALAPLAP